MVCLNTSSLACSGDGTSEHDSDGNGTHAQSDRDADVPDFGNAKPVADAAAPAPIDAAVPDGIGLLPEDATLKIEGGAALPTLQYLVKAPNGALQRAVFRVEDGGFGHIDSDGLFTPTGTRAGVTWIEARVGSTVLRTQLTIELSWTQNGAVEDPNTALQGGHGGVGGEGPGGEISDDLRKTLDDKPKQDASFKWLYPYEGTVFPLGMLAPLMMWSTDSTADAIAVHLSGDHFEYRGYFGRPPSLSTNAPFVRHPIPQAVWEAATNSVAGHSLTIEITLAKGDSAYGPIKARLVHRQRPPQGHRLLPELRHQPRQELQRRDGRTGRQVRRRDARDQARRLRAGAGGG